ncbi:MAG: PaaI family thioesterase [Thermoanaerobaculia bacterium]
MSGQEHYRKLERMYAGAPVNAWYRPELTVGEGRAEPRIPVRREFFHAAGAVHGSVYFKALDDATFFAAASLVEDVFVLTAGFNLQLTRRVSEGELVAVGEVVHSSRRLLLAEAVLSDAEGNQLARGSGSFLRSATPLGPELGYI